MCQQQNNELQEVLNKYLEKEKELDKKMQECINSKNSMQNKTNSSTSHLPYDYESSHARNQQLLKDLEKSKAILRTKSIFTPTDQELYDLAAIYRGFLVK